MYFVKEVLARVYKSRKVTSLDITGISKYTPLDDACTNVLDVVKGRAAHAVIMLFVTIPAGLVLASIPSRGGSSVCASMGRAEQCQWERKLMVGPFMMERPVGGGGGGGPDKFGSLRSGAEGFG